MIYLVKHKGGIELEVTKEIYDRCKNSKEHTCRIIDPKPITPSKPVKVDRWPRKDETGPWYTLSNGKRIKGKRNAETEQAKL